MSDPREFERDPNLSNRPIGRSSASGNSGWMFAGVIAIVLLALAAYSYRGTQVTSTNAPETTTGQSTRAPVPTTPLAIPVVPAQPRP
jgi:hypothetical protein